MRTLAAYAVILVAAPLAIASVLLYAALLHYDDRPIDFGDVY